MVPAKSTGTTSGAGYHKSMARNDYKSGLTNRRARSVGISRREFVLRGYQIHQMAVALMYWSLRTGGDVNSFLGN
jgi:hypothetical protein